MTEALEYTEETTFNDVVKYKSETVGEKEFMTYIRDFDNDVVEKYTYKDMHSLSNKLGNGLLKLGIGKGDGISLFEINSPEFILTVFTTFKLGSYVVLVNTGLKGDSLQYIIDHSDSKALIINWTLIDRYIAIKDQLPKIEHVIVDVNEAPEDFKLPEGTISFQDLLESEDTDIDSRIDAGDMSMLIYTSGTTGLPKATTFTYQGFKGPMLQMSGMIAHGMGRQGDVFYTCLPLFHGNGLQLSTMPAYFAEFPFVLSKRFSASRFWDIIRKFNVTNFNLLGSMPQFLLKQPERDNDLDNKVWRVNSAACPAELIEVFEKRFGVKVYEGYGAVDGGGFGITTFGLENVPVGSIGKPREPAVGEVMDDDMNILPPNSVGELVFFVPEAELEQRQVKYYKNEEASKSRIQPSKDGKHWFLTGDLVRKDEDGWFFFVDRKKDSIRRRGENIAAWSIERVINQYDKVLESAAYGIKSTEWAEDEVMVAVILKPGESMTAVELLDFCQDKMADFMIPRFIDFVDKLPKSEVHRILKRFLKDEGVTDTTFDREKKGYEIKK